MLNFFRNLKKRLRLNLRRSTSAARSDPEAPPSSIPSTTENQASTSNTPSREKPSLEPTSDTAHPAPAHNTNRSELVGVLNRSTQGEVGKQIQRQGILKRKMEHPLNTANTRETEDARLPNPAENPDTFLGGPITVVQIHTFETLPRQSEDERANQDVPNSSNSDWSASQTTDSQHRSIPSYRPHALQLNASAVSGGAPAEGRSLSQHLNQTLTTEGANRSFMDLMVQNEASSSRFSFFLVQEEWSTLQASTEVGDAHALHNSEGLTATDRLNNIAQKWASISKRLLSLEASNKGASGRSSKALSPEDNRDQCRICYDVYVSPDDPLLSPCLCSGSLKFVHYNCLKTWIQIRLQSGRSCFIVKRCELCKGWLKVDQKMFHCEESNQSHRQVTNILEVNSPLAGQRSGSSHGPVSRTYSIQPVYRYPRPVSRRRFRRTGGTFVHPVALNAAAQNPSNVDSVQPYMEV